MWSRASDEREAVLRQQGKEVTLPHDVVYMLAGVDRTSLPTDFYKRCKIAYDRDWHLWRSFGLIFSILLVGAFYLTKKIHPDLIRIGSWNLDKLYPLTYSVVVLVFGIKAIRRWGAFRWKPSPRKHGNQTLRLSSLIFFQVFFFFIVPGTPGARLDGLQHLLSLASGPGAFDDSVHHAILRLLGLGSRFDPGRCAPVRTVSWEEVLYLGLWLRWVWRKPWAIAGGTTHPRDPSTGAGNAISTW